VNIELLERAAAALDDLLDEVVFVGGATLELWITRRGAVEVRPTEDVDVVVEVATRTAFHDFEARLRGHGFAEAQDSRVICRWRHTDSQLVLDAMPAQAAILGFENRWQAAALPHSVERELPSGRRIRAAPPPFLLAMKLEAFNGRGRGDFLGSRDFEDIALLLDRRAELVDETEMADEDLRRYVAAEAGKLLDDPRTQGGLMGAVPPDAASQDRVPTVLLPALRALADLAS
jgi:hypothetical protein